MPTNSEFVISHKEDGSDRKLVTPRYTVTDDGFRMLIDYVNVHGRLPTDRALTMTESFAQKTVDVYESIRFKKALETMNAFIIKTTHDIYKQAMKPIEKNKEALAKMGLIEEVTTLNSLFGIEVQMFNTNFLLQSWSSATKVTFPKPVIILHDCDAIGKASYPYLNNPEWKKFYDTSREKLKDLNNMRQDFSSKIQKNNSKLTNMFYQHSTTKQILENISPDIEYDVLSLALDIVHAIRESGYGVNGAISPLYKLDTIQKVYESNNFAVELNITPVKKTKRKLKAVS